MGYRRVGGGDGMELESREKERYQNDERGCKIEHIQTLGRITSHPPVFVWLSCIVGKKKKKSFFFLFFSNKNKTNQKKKKKKN